MLIWLIGVSGAGKTTLGSYLMEYYKDKGEPAYMIDGDEVRAVFDGDLGYNREDREANIKRIILAAYVLDRCDINTVVCNISPFQHLRELARKKIKGYNEIYLKKDLDNSIKNDVKGVYSQNKDKTELIGVDIDFDEPRNPDLIIDTDADSVQTSCDRIVRYIEGKKHVGL